MDFEKFAKEFAEKHESKIEKELKKIRLTDQDLADIVRFYKPRKGIKLNLENMDEDEKDNQLIIHICDLIGLVQRISTSRRVHITIGTFGRPDNYVFEYACELVGNYLFDAESVISTYNQYVRLYNLKPQGKVLEEFLKLPKK